MDAKMQQQYESRITQLEGQLDDVETAKTTAARIKEHVDRQHAEIRRLMMSSGPNDDAFRDRPLRELRLTEDEMEKELSLRSQQPPAAGPNVCARNANETYLIWREWHSALTRVPSTNERASRRAQAANAGA